MAEIKEEEVKKIASIEKSSGCQELAEILKLKEYNEENDLKAAIYIDYLYDNVMFAAEKGFSWHQVSVILQFALDFLQQCQGKSLSDAIRCYRDISGNLAQILGERNYKQYTDYVFSTFMTHYQLFTYVFTQERQTNVPYVSLEVNVPIPPEELSTSKPNHIWQYEKKIESLEDLEMTRISERIQVKEKLALEDEGQQLAVQEKIFSAELPLTKESLGEMIRNVMQSYTTSTATSLKTTVKELGEDLNLMLEKTSLPRPQALGPPPRYKLRTPITSTAAGKSRQNKSHDSDRSSRKSPKSAKSKT
ncbi:uncharacterized protein C8orf74 homolog [Haliotis asinina]|uniref:uncharacterized protein C8orf74 homolog n=1 Tax=Haliotis asinina TaxID=109174 RepID=UPI003532308A